MIILLNKPFNVLCQFSDEQGRATLADFVQQPAVYPAGRLDFDSEGLVLLTDEGMLSHRITDPRHHWSKTYWAQVEGVPTAAQIESLRRGVLLKDGPTRPAAIAILEQAPECLWPRHPPIRFRAAIPTTWLSLTLSEGRNRQVRRMTAAVGLPTLRLIRAAIGPFRVDDLAPGASRIVTL